MNDASRRISMEQSDVIKYLTRIGVERPQWPSVDALFEIQRAHVERIPYETLDGYLDDDQVVSMKPAYSVAKVLNGRGGYCFQTNVTLGMLLRALGYEAEFHWGEVRFTPEEDAADSEVLSGGHLALTVRAEGETWLLDTGMGDAIYEPLPLREGRYQQAPFELELERWRGAPDGWRFRNDPAGSFVSMVFTTRPSPLDVFEPVLAGLARSSRFSRTLTVQRRHRTGADVLRGRVLTHVDETGRTRKIIKSKEDWFECLTGLFGIRLPRMTAAQREAMWQRALPKGRRSPVAAGLADSV